MEQEGRSRVSRRAVLKGVVGAGVALTLPSEISAHVSPTPIALNVESNVVTSSPAEVSEVKPADLSAYIEQIMAEERPLPYRIPGIREEEHYLGLFFRLPDDNRIQLRHTLSEDGEITKTDVIFNKHNRDWISASVQDSGVYLDASTLGDPFVSEDGLVNISSRNLRNYETGFEQIGFGTIEPGECINLIEVARRYTNEGVDTSLWSEVIDPKFDLISRYNAEFTSAVNSGLLQESDEFLKFIEDFNNPVSPPSVFPRVHFLNFLTQGAKELYLLQRNGKEEMLADVSSSTDGAFVFTDSELEELQSEIASEY